MGYLLRSGCCVRLRTVRANRSPASPSPSRLPSHRRDHRRFLLSIPICYACIRIPWGSRGEGKRMHLRCVAEHVGAPAVAFWHELTVIRVTKWPRSPTTGRFRLTPRGKFVRAGALLRYHPPGITIISRVYGPAVFIRRRWPRRLTFYCRFTAAVIVARRIPEIRNENKRAAAARGWAKRGLSLESRIARGEKGAAQKGRVGCMFRAPLGDARLGHLRKPRCLWYLFFTSGKEAFSIIDNAN